MKKTEEKDHGRRQKRKALVKEKVTGRRQKRKIMEEDRRER